MDKTIEESRYGNTDLNKLSRKIGFAMASTSTVFGILYLIGLVAI